MVALLMLVRFLFQNCGTKNPTVYTLLKLFFGRFELQKYFQACLESFATVVNQPPKRKLKICTSISCNFYVRYLRFLPRIFHTIGPFTNFSTRRLQMSQRIATANLFLDCSKTYMVTMLLIMQSSCYNSHVDHTCCIISRMVTCAQCSIRFVEFLLLGNCKPWLVEFYCTSCPNIDLVNNNNKLWHVLIIITIIIVTWGQSTIALL